MPFNISGSFSVLTLMLAGVFSLVPPPENVTVTCHNFQTTVSWDYSKQHPKTGFKLNIVGSAGSVNVSVTDEHRYNLTSFVWESEKRFSAYHAVKVSATEGEHESKMVENSFKFNKLKTANIQCFLDFPNVTLSVYESVATVKFPNPQHYYKTLKQAGPTGEFKFTVHLLNDTDNQGQQMVSLEEHEIRCPMEKENCTYSFPRERFPEMEKYCIMLKGRLDGGMLYDVPFRPTNLTCAEEEDTDTDSLIILAVVLSVFGIVVCVVTFMIVKAQAWQMIPSSLPEALKTPMASGVYGNVINIPYEIVSSVSVTETDFNKSDSSLIVATAEEKHCSETQTYCSRSERSSPKPIGSTYLEGGLSESSSQKPESETYESERCSEEDSLETASATLDPEEECSSGYDRPHRLEMDVDMGHGDVVKCYNR